MRGVIVTGHMRSGTSMVAGLFAAHGVFFGDCGGPNERNEKGNFENRWLKQKLKEGGIPNGWEGWRDHLKEEGWHEDMPWGLKAVAVHWPTLRGLFPSVVVNVYRPKKDIIASCEAGWTGWKYEERHRSEMIEAHWRIMETIKLDYPGTVVDVDSPDLIRGEYDAILPAFEALDVEFSAETADTWIEADLWHWGSS